MNSKIIKITFLSGLLWLTQSCSDFVDVVPDNIAVIDDAFASRLSTQRFLSSMYGRMQTMLPGGGVENPSVSPRDPSVTSTDEIWLNDFKRLDNLNRPVGVAQHLLGGQNVLSPLFDAWGGTGINNLYIGIRDANIFLEKIDIPFDLDEQEKKLWIAEAKFLKAYFHFSLLRMYGPIPIGNTNIQVSSGLEAVRVKRDPVDEVVDYIVQLCDEAIADLPAATMDMAQDAGRANGMMASVLKAKTLMLAASPLFNGNEDLSGLKNKDGEQLVSQIYDPQKWERAELACKEAIDIAHSAGRKLYEAATDPSWSDTTQFKMNVRGSVTAVFNLNTEVLWPNTNESTRPIQAASRPRLRDGVASKEAPGFWAPTMRIAEMFYSENGVPIEEDLAYDYENRFEVVNNVGADHKHYVLTGFDAPRLHLNREVRFYASLGFDGGIWLEDQESGTLNEDDPRVVRVKNGDYSSSNGPGPAFSATGYFAKKLSHPLNFQRPGTSQNVGFQPVRYPWPVSRLADIYLLYAEALNENGKIAEAQQWIDQVRERSGLKGVVESWAAHAKDPAKPTNKEGLREIIHRERMIELVFEGHRFWDLRRWKKAQDYLNRDIRGWNRLGTNTEEYYKVKVLASPTFLNRNYLWPIAEGDMIRNPQLVQNPGW